MKLTDLQVDGFGIWSGLSVSDLSDKVTVIFGRNEAGKTTLLQFIRSMLYGFTAKRRERYLPPVHGKMVGGSLYVASDQGNIEIQRHVRPGEPDDILPALTFEDGRQGGQDLLDQLLAGVDEQIFTNVFAIGLREIQHLGTLNDSQVAEHLYTLASGLDRVSLVEVTRRLETSRGQILAPDGEASEISSLFEQYEELDKRIDQLTQRGREWSERAAQHESLMREIDDLNDDVKQLEHESRLLEVAVQVREPWIARRDLDDQLAVLGVPSNVDERSVEELQQLNAKIKRRREQIDQIKSKQRELREEADELPINRRVWAQVSRIEALGEHLPWIASLESQISRLEQERKVLTEQLESICRVNDIPLDDISSTLSTLTRDSLTLLEEPSHAVRMSAKQLKEAVASRDQSTRQADELHHRIRESLGGKTDLTAALETAGDRVAQIRRRIQLDERLEKLCHTQEELEIDIDELLDRHVLPVWQVAALGTPFAIGVILILGGLVWSTLSVIGWPLAILGLVGWGIAVAAKHTLEQRTERELKACDSQMSRVRDQIKQGKHERDELDAQLLISGGESDLATRLQLAEQKLEELEELLPLESQRQAFLQQRGQAHQQAEAATSAATTARENWVQVLRAVGLPSQIAPSNTHALIGNLEQLIEIWRRLSQTQEDLDNRQTELDAICQRIEDVTADAGLEIADEDIKRHLRFLLNTLSDQQYMFQQRKTLIRRHRDLRNERRKCGRAASRAKQRRMRILADARVDNEDELLQVIEQLAETRQMREQREVLTHQITNVVGDQITENDVEHVFKEFSDSALERRWDEITEQLEVHQLQLGEWHQSCGELKQEMKSIAQDSGLEEARFELGCVRQRLKEAIRQWQVLAVVSMVLETLQTAYETDRQPAALQDASQYMEQLTEGKYVRIWAPMEQRTLRVDDAKGHSLSVDVLSRGTREAVYLSLRLALASMFADHGIRLPVVLDDVLVNLDGDRTKAAAKTLRDFAKSGHQILLFTCHEHIMKAFKAVKAEIRTLPDSKEVAQAAIQVNFPPTDKAEEPKTETVIESLFEEDATDTDFLEGTGNAA